MSLSNRNLPRTGGAPSNYEPLATGNYDARLVQAIGLGLQSRPPYKGEEKSPCYQILTTFELVDQFMKDEDGNVDPKKPRWLSQKINMFSNAEKGREVDYLNALDPQGRAEGDWSQLLGAQCSVQVVQNEGKGKFAGRVFENIRGILPLDSRIQIAPLVNDTKVFDALAEKPDLETFKSLPEWIQNLIKGGESFAGSALDRALSGSEPEQAPSHPEDMDDFDDDDIPFN